MLRSASIPVSKMAREERIATAYRALSGGGWSGPNVAKTKEAKAPGRRLKVDYMTRTERVMAAVNGSDLDRVPVCFWHHFQPEGSGRAMAEATLQFFDEEF